MTINISNSSNVAQAATQTLPMPGPSNISAQSTAPLATAPLAKAPLAKPNPPTLNVVKRKALPTGVASNVKQLALSLLDVSSSMSGQKIDELNIAVPMFFRELAAPESKDGFIASVIEFNQSARLIIDAEPASQLICPNFVAGGSTNFDAPINMAIQQIEAFAQRPNPDGWHYLRPQVFIMSDGQAPVADKNIQRLHEIADVTAIAYGSDADQATLSRIASDGQVHVIGVEGSQLRSFLAQVGRTMTETMLQNI